MADKELLEELYEIIERLQKLDVFVEVERPITDETFKEEENE